MRAFLSLSLSLSLSPSLFLSLTDAITYYTQHGQTINEPYSITSLFIKNRQVNVFQGRLGLNLIISYILTFLEGVKKEFFNLISNSFFLLFWIPWFQKHVWRKEKTKQKQQAWKQ